MLKSLSLALLSLFMLQNAHAQTSVTSDTLKYYFDANNIETGKESADHSIFILPKSEKDGGFYPMIGYYKNGKISMMAFLKTQNLDNQFEGPINAYYPNGNKKRTANYHNGLITGEAIDFFENGNQLRVTSFKQVKTRQQKSKATEYFQNGTISKILDYDAGRSTQLSLTVLFI